MNKTYIKQNPETTKTENNEKRISSVGQYQVTWSTCERRPLTREERHKTYLKKKNSNMSPKFGENNKPTDPKSSTKLKQKK